MSRPTRQVPRLTSQKEELSLAMSTVYVQALYQATDTVISKSLFRLERLGKDYESTAFCSAWIDNTSLLSESPARSAIKTDTDVGLLKNERR